MRKRNYYYGNIETLNLNRSHFFQALDDFVCIWFGEMFHKESLQLFVKPHL